MNMCKYIVYKLGPQVKKKFNSMSIEHNKKNAHKKGTIHQQMCRYT